MTITNTELLEKYGSKIFVTKELNGQILEIRDKGKDSTMGGYYFFYSNGHLKS